jgi:hypothetical protein
MRALLDQWETLIRQAYDEFDDQDMAKFKRWLQG